MTKFLKIILLLSFGTISAHQNVIFQKSYGNVNLISSTSFCTEEINRNIIIAKYVELLLKELNYKNPIYLRLTHDSEFKCLAFFEKGEFQNKELNIAIFEKEIDILKTLSLVENIILNQKSLNKAKDKFSNWYNSKYSKIVENILSNKIDRPADVAELKSHGSFDYFYQNGIYHILSYQNNEIVEVAQLHKILQFSTPTYSLLFIFTEIDSLTIISANYKYDFNEKQYHPTSETLTLDFKTDWEYSFRPYSIRLLGQKYITIESLFGDSVSLYDITKKKFTQNLLSKLEEY